jgi:LPS sulfotransferase NodH
MHLYKEQFSEKYDFPGIDNPKKTLIIASTPRSGSHMLGHGLYQSKKFGFPLEYLNSSNLAEWKKRLKLNTTKEVLRAIQKRRTSPNGVFGIKIHYSHISQLGGFHCLSDFFPNAYFIFLSRKEVLRQAVSLSIARQTGVWISGQTPVNNSPVYDFNVIDKCLREILLDNSSWRYSLAASGSNYIDINYEKARNNLQETIKTIAEFLNIQIDEDEIPIEHVTKKQNNNMKREWIDRFISDYDPSNSLMREINNDLISKIISKLKNRGK